MFYLNGPILATFQSPIAIQFLIKMSKIGFGTQAHFVLDQSTDLFT